MVCYALHKNNGLFFVVVMIGSKLKQTVRLHHKRTELDRLKARFGLGMSENSLINCLCEHIDGFDLLNF